MIDFRGLFKHWYEIFSTPRHNAFYPFELAYFNRVFEALGFNSASLLKKQIEVINRVQRIDSGKMVNIYKITRGKSDFFSELKLDIFEKDMKLFSSKIYRYNGGNQCISVKVFVVCGHIFEMQYSESPRVFFDKNPKTHQYHIGDIKFHIDPSLIEKAASKLAERSLRVGATMPSSP